MCRTEEEIHQEYPILDEIEKHRAKNNLTEREDLLLRLMKHNFVANIQVKDDLVPIAKHAEVCKKNPSLTYRFRYQTGRVLTEWSAILFFSYVMFRMAEVMLGLDEMLKALVP